MSSRVWWGHYALEEGRVLRWRIGPLELWLRRLPREWRISHRRGDAHAPDALETAVPEAEGDVIARTTLERFVVGGTPSEVVLTPALADRPVVVRPLTPFHLGGGAEVTVYVSTPLWVHIAAGEVFMTGIATERPSDTWFGPSTGEGELCYAGHTHCRLSVAELPWRPSRAVTPLLIRNRERLPLLIERLNLPVAYLSLFANERGELWTPTVTIERGQGMAPTLDVGMAPPAEIGPTRLVGRPRSEPAKGGVIRVFTSLFG